MWEDIKTNFNKKEENAEGGGKDINLEKNVKGEQLIGVGDYYTPPITYEEWLANQSNSDSTAGDDEESNDDNYHLSKNNMAKIDDLNLAIQNFAEQVGLDINDLRASQGKLADLTTTQKASLVAAINDIEAGRSALATDVATNYAKKADVTTEIDGKVATAISNLIGGSSEALDTLKEIADAFKNADGDLMALIQDLSDRGVVRFDIDQTLTDAQKVKARTNIGALSDAEVESKATTVANARIDAVVGTAAVLDFEAVYQAKISEAPTKGGEGVTGVSN